MRLYLHIYPSYQAQGQSHSTPPGSAAPIAEVAAGGYMPLSTRLRVLHSAVRRGDRAGSGVRSNLTGCTESALVATSTSFFCSYFLSRTTKSSLECVFHFHCHGTSLHPTPPILPRLTPCQA